MKASLERNDVHSSTLVHWTGRRLQEEAERDGESADLPRRYVDLLWSIISEGLWCQPPRLADVVHGVGENVVELPRSAVVCFTELNQDDSDFHTRKYGTLGIGFCRDYLLKCGANPVFYVQSGRHGIVNTNLVALEFATQCDLLPVEIRGALRSLLSYFKPMSATESAAAGASLDFYNELEWRIVPSDLLSPTGGMERPAVFDHDGRRWRFRFEAGEARLVVFPDADTMSCATADARISGAFREGEAQWIVHPSAKR